MSGPRAGYSGFLVRVRDESGAEVERWGSNVPSTLVHRSCQAGPDCNGAGCRIRTGKTSGTLADARLWHKRMEQANQRREDLQRAAVAASRTVAEVSHAA